MQNGLSTDIRHPHETAGYWENGPFKGVVNLKWTPGSDGDTIHAPNSDMGVFDRNQIFVVIRSYLNTANPMDTGTLIVDDGTCHGGRLAYNVGLYAEVHGKKNVRGPRSNATTTWIPYGNGKNGTFIDLSKHKDYKIPPMNISPPKIKGPANAHGELCGKSSNPNPMIPCAGMAGTIIAGTTVAQKNNPNGILLKSSTGNYLTFSGDAGALCVEVLNEVHKYWCWGGNNNNKGPFAFTLHTNGALCLYNSSNAFACTAGSTNDGMYRLIIQDDGNLVIYRGGGINKPIWSSGTNWSKATGSVTCPVPYE
jgi:hypothetical protein